MLINCKGFFRAFLISNLIHCKGLGFSHGKTHSQGFFRFRVFSLQKTQCKGFRYIELSHHFKGFWRFLMAKLIARVLEFPDGKAHCKGFRVFSCQSSFTSVSGFGVFSIQSLHGTFNYKDQKCAASWHLFGSIMCRVRSEAVAIIGIRAAQGKMEAGSIRVVPTAKGCYMTQKVDDF